MSERRAIIELAVLYAVFNIAIAIFGWLTSFLGNEDGIPASGLLATMAAVFFVASRHVKQGGGAFTKPQYWKIAGGALALIVLWDVSLALLSVILLKFAGEPGLFEEIEHVGVLLGILAVIAFFIYGIVLLVLRYLLPHSINRELKRLEEKSARHQG